MSTAPIFILGANRSGTTLLRLMLNAHSHIAVPEEMLYYRSFYANVPIEDWRAPNLPENVYEDLARTFVGNAVQLHAELGSLPLLDCILEAPTRDLRHPYRVVMDAWAEIHGKARWGEKTPGNLFYLDVIYDMFPDAKFVYLSRDPRAGTASMQRADFFPVDVVFNALSRRKHFETAWRLLHNHVPAQQWTCLRYEDLVRAPRKTLISLCDFLSEEFEPGMLAYHRTASTYMKEDAATGFNAAATRPVSTKSVEAWRDQLSPQAIALVESICDGEMEASDYTPSNVRLSWSARIVLMLKTAYWNWQVWRHRTNRHYTVKAPLFARLRHRLGFSPPASHSVARR